MRSTRVTATGARPSPRAAARPPKPPPTTTTCGLESILHCRGRERRPWRARSSSRAPRGPARRLPRARRRRPRRRATRRPSSASPSPTSRRSRERPGEPFAFSARYHSAMRSGHERARRAGPDSERDGRRREEERSGERLKPGRGRARQDASDRHAAQQQRDASRWWRASRRRAGPRRPASRRRSRRRRRRARGSGRRRGRPTARRRARARRRGARTRQARRGPRRRRQSGEHERRPDAEGERDVGATRSRRRSSGRASGRATAFARPRERPRPPRAGAARAGGVEAAEEDDGERHDTERRHGGQGAPAEGLRREVEARKDDRGARGVALGVAERELRRACDALDLADEESEAGEVDGVPQDVADRPGLPHH